MSGGATGFIGAAIAVVLWGTYAVPVKLVDTGDGIVFQWITCTAILFVGFIAQFVVGQFNFYPLAMIGGAIWAVGNVTVVPIVGFVGMSLGMLIWNAVNLATGWLAGHFGIWVTADPPAPNPALNIAGFVIAVASVALYLPIKSAPKPTASSSALPSTDPAQEPLVLNAAPSPSVDLDELNDMDSAAAQASPASSIRNKVIGMVMAVLAGLCYGVNMLPVQVLQGQTPNANPLQFAFSHYTGIWFCSTAILIGYGLVKCNKPFVNPKMILPGLVSGAGWGVAQSAAFYANATLGLTTAYPIICTGPSLVASLVGIVAFKEISGLRNFLWLGAASLATLTGIVMITLSHI
jgi:glucose uptake protein GlcU